jgi:mRNA interferase RelE/StbE
MTLIWNVEWDDRARKELRKLDKQAQKDILTFLRNRIATSEDPKRFGKSLSYDKYGLWRYRVHDYRIICRIYEDELTVLAVSVGHRKEIYE